MQHKFDAIMIGTGQAGPSLAKRFSKEGYTIAVIEEGRYGGSCVNYGCTPTKTLVANAKIAHSVKISKEFGVDVTSFKIDYKKIKERKDSIVIPSSEGVKNSLVKLEHCTVFEGHASFQGPHLIKVGSDVLEGDKIFINVGARPYIPDIPNLKNVSYFTNDTLLDIDYLPEQLVILGGGYIGLEFAQVFNRFGSKVTVIHNKPFIMPNEDEDISHAIQDILKKDGIEIVTNAKNFAILSDGNEKGFTAQFECNGNNQKISGSHLLVATGRVPNTDTLDLENAGIEVDKKGYIVVDDSLRTTQSHVWALGDCNGKGAFTHTSYNDYQIVSANLFDGGSRKVTDRIPIYAMFIDPPLGRVGITEREARKLKDEEIFIAKIPMSDIARAREKGETEGFLKIIVNERSKQILGAAFLGIGCDEVVQMIAVVMEAKIPYMTIDKTVLIHPTVSEFLPTLLSNLKSLKELPNEPQSPEG